MTFSVLSDECRPAELTALTDLEASLGPYDEERRRMSVVGDFVPEETYLSQESVHGMPVEELLESSSLPPAVPFGAVPPRASRRRLPKTYRHAQTNTFDS